jgi:hypothetical protein
MQAFVGLLVTAQMSVAGQMVVAAPNHPEDVLMPERGHSLETPIGIKYRQYVAPKK